MLLVPNTSYQSSIVALRWWEGSSGRWTKGSWESDDKEGPNAPNTCMKILFNWWMTEGSYLKFCGKNNDGVRKVWLPNSITTQFLEQTTGSWDAKSVLNKIHHIQRTFNEAHNFAGSEAGAEILKNNREATFQDRVKQECPFYFDIHDIMNDCASTEQKATSYDLDDTIADIDEDGDREDKFTRVSEQVEHELWNIGLQGGASVCGASNISVTDVYAWGIPTSSRAKRKLFVEFSILFQNGFIFGFLNADTMYQSFSKAESPTQYSLAWLEKKQLVCIIILLLSKSCCRGYFQTTCKVVSDLMLMITNDHYGEGASVLPTWVIWCVTSLQLKSQGRTSTISNRYTMWKVIQTLDCWCYLDHFFFLHSDIVYIQSTTTTTPWLYVDGRVRQYQIRLGVESTTLVAVGCSVAFSAHIFEKHHESVSRGCLFLLSNIKDRISLKCGKYNLNSFLE